MQQKLVVFNGTAINKYNMVFTVGALESGLNQSWEIGLPSCVGHDLHRPIAWSKALSLYFEPGLVRLAGRIFVPENADDEKEIHETFQYQRAKMVGEEFEPHRTALEQKLAGVLTEKAYGLMPGCAVFFDQGLAEKRFPDIFKDQDKHGLIQLSSLNPVGPGVYEIDGLLLFAHPFFRRSLSRHNSLNSPFLSVFQKVSEKHDIDVKVALDRDMIGLASTYKEYIELEYWWGPKFSDELSEIDFGVTRHEASKDQRLFHGVSSAEFWWHNQNGIRTLECEELKDIPSLGVGKDSFGCRYVHSMLSSDTGLSNHIDGAIRLYDENSMIERLEQDISKSGKGSNYTKLWRIDGKFNVALWKELLTHYYRDNHLIGEYLGGEDENKHLRPREISSDIYEIPLSKNVPCNIERGHGPRLSVSYHKKTESLVNLLEVRPTDFIILDDGRHNYIDGDTIEIIKLLKIRGIDVKYPDHTLLIAFNDMVLNLPLLIFDIRNGIEISLEIQNAFLRLCEAWREHGDNRIISYNIGICYSEKDVYYSIAGHVDDLIIWLKSEESKFPSNENDIGKWAELASNFISENFPHSIDYPPLHNFLQPDGLLHFKRRFLKPSEYSMHYDEKAKGVVWKYSYP